MYFKGIRLLLPSLIVAGSSSFGQVVAVQNEANYVYLGWPNHLTIAVEGYKSSSIFVSTDNGRIEAYETSGPGRYVFWPAHIGTAQIFVKRRTKNSGMQLIRNVTYRVKRLPLSKATLGGKSSGEIEQSFLLCQIAPVERLEGICGYYSLPKFEVRVVRRQRVIFQRTLADDHGARIDDVTYDFFHRLKDNDRVIFENMEIKDLDGARRQLEPIEFTVVNTHKYHRVYANDTENIVDPVTGMEHQKIIKYRWERKNN